jgi:hypothetical protein
MKLTSHLVVLILGINQLTDFNIITYTTNWNVTGSIANDVIGFLNSLNPSSRTMALGSIQSLTGMSAMNIPEGKGRPVHNIDNFTAICDTIV